MLVGRANRRFLETILLGPLASASGGRRIGFVSPKPTLGELQALAILVEAGKRRPRIDRRLPQAELPEAIRHVELGHARRKVLATI